MELAGFIEAPCVSHTVNQDRSFTHLTRMRYPATGVPSAAASDGACDRGTALDHHYDYDYDLLPATGQQDGHRTAAP